MYSKDLLLLACLGVLLGGLRLTSTTTTTTFVAAMSIGNQDLERYFRSVNSTHALASMTEERIAMDLYTYAFLNYSYHDTEQHNVSFNEEKARYGEGRMFSVRGKLVHVTNAQDPTDDSACTADILGTRGESTPPAGVIWIALVQRGGCTFEEKVQHVFDKGAYGVIIYNDKPVVNLEKMQIKGKTRNITAVITYQDIGLEMARIVDQGIDMEAAIIEGRSGMRPINNLNRTSVLFVSISFIVLMVISLVWLIFYYIQRFRYLQTKDQQSRHLCSVTKKAIMKIPTKTGKSSDEKDADSDCCAICIETYKASDCIRVLPCKHEFHKNCIDPWLIEHRTCPMCKLDVLKFYGFVVGDQINTTPSPQHIPPVVAPVDENDVPVVVVAVASGPTTTHVTVPASSSLSTSTSADAVEATAAAAAATATTANAALSSNNCCCSSNNNNNSNSSNRSHANCSDSNNSNSDSNNSTACCCHCHINSCNKNNNNNNNNNANNSSVESVHACNCNQQSPNANVEQQHVATETITPTATCVEIESPNVSVTETATSTPVTSTTGVILVRQVSTASRQVTDV